MLHPYVVMLSQPGLAQQVVEQVLKASEVETIDLLTAESAQDTPAVVVMVEGDHEELWDRARELAMPVVLVTNGELDAVGIVDAVLRGADAIVHLTARPPMSSRPSTSSPPAARCSPPPTPAPWWSRPVCASTTVRTSR